MYALDNWHSCACTCICTMLHISRYDIILFLRMHLDNLEHYRSVMMSADNYYQYYCVVRYIIWPFDGIHLVQSSYSQSSTK